MSNTKAMKAKIKEMQRIARDLCYKEDMIKRFVNAKTEIELNNMMVSARRASD